MNKQELIGKYEDKLKDVQLKFGASFKTKAYEELIEDLKQLDEPQPIKLKDVTARIKQLDIGTRKVWLDEFLNELGSDYGTLKYKDGYEQGKVEGLIEREKVIVPQFVADWIEYCKITHVDLQHALIVGDVYFYNYANQKDFSKLKEFLETENNQETFARAWLDGYTVEVKRYRVNVKNVRTRQGTLNRSKKSGVFIFSNPEENNLYGTKFTRKELEDAGFGEVFNSPLFEVEEVE